MATNSSIVDVLTAWSLDPSILLGVALAAWIYVSGLRGLKRRSRQGQVILRRHVTYFALGLLAVVLALGPICKLSTKG